MRILILGGSGMLGHKLFQVLSDRFDTFATFREPTGPWTKFPMYENCTRTLGGINALDFDSVVAAVSKSKPDAVVNCIGVVKQLMESRDPFVSVALNALFPHRLANLCVASGARLIHVSTDCVFSGRKGNYSENDAADAEDMYGRTKFLGEVQKSGCLTIRTSFFGRDFLKRIGLLEWFLSQQGKNVFGYKNVVFTGFPTLTLSEIIGDIIAEYPDLVGLYHVASPPTSKYNLLIKIRDALGLEIGIEPVDDPSCDRGLSANRFAAATGYRFPSWDEMIEELSADDTPYEAWRERYALA